MTDAVGPGDVLVCVKYPEPGFPYDEFFDALVPGSLYKVADVHCEHHPSCICPWDACGLEGFKLVGIKQGKYCPNLFRRPGDYFTNMANESGLKVEDEGFAEPKVIKPVTVPEKVDA